MSRGTKSSAESAVFRRSLAVLPVLITVAVISVFADRGGEVSALTDPTDDLVNYETPHVYPIDLTPDESTLVAVNIAAHRLEVFDVTSGTPVLTQSIPVGLDPVSVRARTNDEVWVVNHLSDSVSVVDLDQGAVVATLQTDNEPADVVFANNRAFVTASEANAVNVFNLSNLDAAPQKISIAGEDPRALAVSEDGSTVYAAIFESGNGTTALAGGESVAAGNVVSRLEGPYQGQNPPPNVGNSFSPAINSAIGTPPQTALIVRRDANGNWFDDNNGNWTRFVSGDLAPLSARATGWDLADNDVAVINTATLGVSYRSRLMNINMALAVNPATDDITVVGTEARNEVRFEPNLNGNFVTVMMANLDSNAGNNTGQAISDLNPHLDYSTPTVSPTEREKSIGDPRGIAWAADGSRAFVTGMGSNNVVVSTANGSRIGQFDVGQGPTGIVLASGNRGFVMNKFAGSISVIDTANLAELDEVAFFDPTPQVIKDGRPVMYDTHETSGTGHLSCASCHVDSRTDRLAWDLGNPAGSLDQVNRLDGSGRPVSGSLTVSPMKGPMLTQSLQDIMDFPTMHWRGDRANIGEFNPTFVNLMGRTAQVGPSQMQALGDFLGTIHFPPNPYREIDGTRPATVVLPNGATATTSNFNSLRGDNSRNNTCLNCHYRQAPRNNGSNDELRQAFVPSSWVPWYDRLGYWPESANGSTTGFGFFHDGADSIGGAARTTNAERQTDMLAEIMTLEGPTSGLIGGERRQDTHAGVGQQVTITGQASSAEAARLNELLAIDSGSPFAAMVVKTAESGLPRGFMRLANGNFAPDRAGDPTLTTNQVLALAQAGESVTFTLVAGGTEQRLGIDIDADGVLDGDEDPIGPPPGSIVGDVRRNDGAPISGTIIDIFAQTANGGVGEFIDNAVTGTDSRYEFSVDAGCYILRFQAPEGYTFFNDSQLLDQAICVESGAVASIDLALTEEPVPDPSIGGSVTTEGGSGVAGVNVDRFLANSDGSRGAYLGSATTGDDGRYNFDSVLPLCYVLTFEAPEGQTFNGSRWLEQARCVSVGQQIDDANAVLDGAAAASIGGTITAADGSPAVGIGVDLFEQSADGSRGQWLGDTTTDGSGNYSFGVDPDCYVATLIAPTGQTFNGSQWFQTAGCVTAGQTLDTLDGVLDGSAEASLGGSVLFANGDPVAGAQVDFFGTNADGSRGAYSTTVFTDSTGVFFQGVPAACHWLVFVAPDGEQFVSGSQWAEAFRCVTSGETVTDLSATVQ